MKTYRSAAGSRCLMDSLNITKIQKPENRNLIFISAGDCETFAKYASMHLTGYFDLAVFYYGGNERKAKDLSDASTIFAAGVGTKFNSLKCMHEKIPGLLHSYETVWVCDDDLVPVKGNFIDVPDILNRFHLKVISPAQSLKGKISHQIMVQLPGEHIFRYVNFVEMGWPLFRSDALAGFLDIYDGSLSGYGIDWWFMNHFDARNQLVAGIVDQVVFLNPHEARKKGGIRELDLYMDNGDQMRQWNQTKKRNNLLEWERKNLYRVFPDRVERTRKWSTYLMIRISRIYFFIKRMLTRRSARN